MNGAEKASKFGEVDSKRSLNRRRWLITGGCGFVGTNLVKELLDGGNIWVRIVDNLSVGKGSDLGRVCKFEEIPQTTLENEAWHRRSNVPRVELIRGDVLNSDLAFNAARDTDVIVHLAASTGVRESVRDPRHDCMTNIIGTLNYLEAARAHNVPRFIFASSGAPVGECKLPINEEIAPRPVSPYGASKMAGEAYCSAFFRTFGVEAVTLRFGNVYGPGSNHKNSLVAKFIRQAIRGEILQVYGDGKQTRDFIYIDDLTRAICRGAEANGLGGEIFQIATGAETSVNEVIEQLLPVLSEVGVDNVRINHGASRTGDVRRNFADTSKAKELLGWESEVQLKDGLAEAVRWFLANCPG